MTDQSGDVRVLYVDDGESAEETAAALDAARSTIAVDTANRPRAALDMLDDEAFDCVLSAYAFPDTNGIAFLRTVREQYGDLPFVLYPADGSEAVASEAIAAGVDDYLPRNSESIQATAVVDRIEAAVERRSTDPGIEIREKADLFDQLFAQLPASLYVKDRDGRHLYMSEYDVTPDDVIGKTDIEIYGDKEFAREAYEDDMRVIETGEPIINKEEYNEANDQWTITSKVPWRGDDGRIKGLIGVTRFITEKKEYEREIERKNDRLEKFASVISHDLRNPLNVAIGHVDLLGQDYDDSRLDRVENALDRMDALIDDILELARHGRDAFEPDKVSLTAVARESWDHVETNDDIELEIASDLRFCGDKPRVQELFENLLANASEHAHPETITIGALADESGFFVADDGPGIPPEEREEVFRPGFTTDREGTGFGLSIAAEICEGHGWEIDVTDSEAGGARFEISGVETC
ncbi:MAG: ATP-binding protein [Halorhabdus sp.]